MKIWLNADRSSLKRSVGHLLSVAAMQKRVMTSAVMVLLAQSPFASRQSHPNNVAESTAKDLPIISYCELVRNASLHTDGQLVRVRATWQYGFEWTYLANQACPDQPKAWVEFLDEDKLCVASKKNLKKMNHKRFDNRADVIVIGKLRRGGGGGMNGAGYQYTFVVSCLESYKKLPLNAP